jgi:hypothetical protein
MPFSGVGNVPWLNSTVVDPGITSGICRVVERLLFLKMPGGPFEHSSLDALSEIAQRARYRSIEAGKTLWREGERAGEACVIVRGTIALFVP